jgi:hypothetical protein
MPKPTGSSQKNVFFFFPSFARLEATAPCGIPAVTTPLMGAVHEIVPITRIVRRGPSLPAGWRLDHKVYRYPVDLWIGDKLNERLGIARGKPAVDTKRLEPALLEAAC